MEEYILRDDTYSFKAVYDVLDTDYETLDIGFSDDEGWCVQFVYQPSKPAEIEMTSVLHHRKCSIEENLENGEGTRRMMKIALSFAFKLFKNAERVRFRDVSQIRHHINGKDTKPIDLPIMKMLLDGTTWYAKHFHAKPEDDWSDVKKKIQTMAEFFRSRTKDDFVKYGRDYWNQVSPEKEIMYSKWYIERGANRATYNICQNETCTPFVGGFRPNGRARV